jgi:uncharacterized membrane protein YGL010W
MSVSDRPLSEVTQEAITLLKRELGVVDTIRFLRQFRPGTGNYTEERNTLLDDLSLEEIFAEAREIQGAQSLDPVRVS